MISRSLKWAARLAVFGLCAGSRAQSWSFTRIADTNTAVPGSTTPFQFFNAPSIDDNVVGFAGFSSSGLTGPAGVYTGSGAALSVVADRQTPSPSGGTFLGFAFGASVWPSISGGAVAFNAGDGTEGGIFIKSGPTITPVGTTLTPIPNGGGANFMVIDSPSLEAGRVAFTGAASLSGGPGGVYSWQSGALSVVADHTTPIPNGPGTFQRVTACDLDQGSIVFSGWSAGSHRGIYLAAPGSALARLYDTTMVVPAGNGGTFTGMGQPVLSNGRVAFIGAGGGQEGFYTDVSGTLHVLADHNTPMPGLPGLHFTGFDSVAIDDGVLAMSGIGGGGGVSGVFSTHTGTLAKVLATGDLLDGRIIADVTIKNQGLEGQSMALWVAFSNGDYGIYMATIPAPAASLALAAALLWNTRRRRPGVTGDRGTPPPLCALRGSA